MDLWWASYHRVCYFVLSARKSTS